MNEARVNLRVLMPLLLASCSQSPEGRAPDVRPDTHTAAAPTAAPTAALAGEWRVAGVDGGQIDLPYAITASISATRIRVTADCINLAWDYRAAGSAISTTRAPVEGCGRGLTAVEEALVIALDEATVFARLPSNAIEISGPRHRVTLFSQ